MNYIEQLLAKIEDAEAKAELTGLVEKAPILNDWILDPGVKAKNDQITTWAETEWDYDHGMSRREWAQQEQLAALGAKGKGMELDELNAHLGKYIKDNGLMTKAEYKAGIEEKETAFNNELNLVSTLATRVAYLNQKYQKDFGDTFDPDEFVSKAMEGGYARQGKQGLDQYYDKFTEEKRTAKQAADLADQIAAAEKRGADKVLAERGMGTNGQMPTLDGAPEMGHFEMKIKGLGPKVDPNASVAPADAELGRGTIARFAANVADQKDRSGHSVN